MKALMGVVDCRDIPAKLVLLGQKERKTRQ